MKQVMTNTYINMTSGVKSKSLFITFIFVDVHSAFITSTRDEEFLLEKIIKNDICRHAVDIMQQFLSMYVPSRALVKGEARGIFITAAMCFDLSF